MHDPLRSIALILLVASLLVSAVGGVRWAKRGSPGPEFVFGASMLVLGMLAVLLVDLSAHGPPVDFATRYTAAWCSHDPARVAALYSESGSLAIDDGAPAVGRKAIEAAARSFMTGYPDLVMEFRGLSIKGERVLYHWTFIGTNKGPGGTGNRVQIWGYDDWKIGADGLIADSKGHTTSRRTVTDK
jgi:uncharacterized protein (TIGR02246 family)